jgi:hypothetical protein
VAMIFRAPSVDETSFNCPHCGALAHQTWYETGAHQLDKDTTPSPWTYDAVEAHLAGMAEKHPATMIESVKEVLGRLASGFVSIYKSDTHFSSGISNIWLTECYNCGQIAVWIHRRLVFPPDITATPEPNTDLPSEVLRDYREAASIVNASPRGAAALLRLCIQKLCDALGQEGKNLDAAIASLVKDGLDPREQKALDTVRVIGNNAVHPGSIDLRDDVATATTLFSLVNLIAEKMITVPKHVDEVYESLPQSAKDRITKRDRSI